MDYLTVRTDAMIISDLLELVIADEWSADLEICYEVHRPGCPNCSGLEDGPQWDYQKRELYKERMGHRPDCTRLQLIEETRALLRVANELAEARGEDHVYIP